MEIALTKTMSGYVPADQHTAEWSEKVKLGAVIHSDFKKARNPAFHRKGFALLNTAFSYWDPGDIDSKFGKPQKNFDRFRKDLTILAGMYEVVIRIDGTTRIEAKSLSFSSMDDQDFEKWYNAVINVILQRIPVLQNMGRDEVDRLVEQVMNFT